MMMVQIIWLSESLILDAGVCSSQESNRHPWWGHLCEMCSMGMRGLMAEHALERK